MQTRSECPVCGGAESRELFRSHDDRYGQPDEFTLVECKRCSLVYLRDYVAGSDLAALYSRYYPDLAHSRIPAKQERDWGSSVSTLIRRTKFAVRARIPGWCLRFFLGYAGLDVAARRGDTVLDCGCGDGDNARFVSARGAAWFGLEVDGRNVAQVRQAGYECYQGTIEELAAREGTREYSLILLSQVLEHVLDPIAALAACRRLLTPSGRVVVCSPNLDSHFRKKYGVRWINWHIPYHICHFNRKSLDILAERAGLRMTRYTTITPNRWYWMQREWEQVARGVRRQSDGRVLSWAAVFLPSFFLRIFDVSGRGDAFLAVFRIAERPQKHDDVARPPQEQIVSR